MPAGDWHPTRVIRLIERHPSSTQPFRVVSDQGEALVKTLDSPEAPGALVSEFVGHGLADLMHLYTFDYALMTESATGYLDEGPISLTAPMFAAKWTNGGPWSGEVTLLDSLARKEDLAGLVVLDTWLRNIDRYCPSPHKENLDNVFIEIEGASRNIVAMDFTHCLLVRSFLGSASGGSGSSQDRTIFGLFPQFARVVTLGDFSRAVNRLCSISKNALGGVVSGVPDAWGLSPTQRSHLVDLLEQRQGFLCGTLLAQIKSALEEI